MPYPESCPECGGAFRNTGTHFTARRNEVGRHVLLELGCQNTSRRYWWDFTTGNLTEDGQTSARRLAAAGAVSSAAATNGSHHAATNGHTSVVTIDEQLVIGHQAEPTALEADPPHEAHEVLSVDPDAADPSAADSEIDLPEASDRGADETPPTPLPNPLDAVDPEPIESALARRPPASRKRSSASSSSIG